MRVLSLDFISAAIAAGGVYEHAEEREYMGFSPPISTGFGNYGLVGVHGDGGVLFCKMSGEPPQIHFVTDGRVLHKHKFVSYNHPVIVVRYFRHGGETDFIFETGRGGDCAEVVDWFAAANTCNSTKFHLKRGDKIPKADETDYKRNAERRAIVAAQKCCTDGLGLLRAFLGAVNVDAFPWSHHAHLRALLNNARWEMDEVPIY